MQALILLCHGIDAIEEETAGLVAPSGERMQEIGARTDATIVSLSVWLHQSQRC